MSAEVDVAGSIQLLLTEDALADSSGMVLGEAVAKLRQLQGTERVEQIEDAVQAIFAGLERLSVMAAEDEVAQRAVDTECVAVLLDFAELVQDSLRTSLWAYPVCSAISAIIGHIPSKRGATLPEPQKFEQLFTCLRGLVSEDQSLATQAALLVQGLAQLDAGHQVIARQGAIHMLVTLCETWPSDDGILCPSVMALGDIMASTVRGLVPQAAAEGSTNLAIKMLSAAPEIAAAACRVLSRFLLWDSQNTQPNSSTKLVESDTNFILISFQKWMTPENKSFDWYSKLFEASIAFFAALCTLPNPATLYQFTQSEAVVGLLHHARQLQKQQASSLATGESLRCLSRPASQSLRCVLLKLGWTEPELLQLPLRQSDETEEQQCAAEASEVDWLWKSVWGNTKEREEWFDVYGESLVGPDAVLSEPEGVVDEIPASVNSHLNMLAKPTRVSEDAAASSEPVALSRLSWGAIPLRATELPEEPSCPMIATTTEEKLIVMKRRRKRLAKGTKGSVVYRRDLDAMPGSSQKPQWPPPASARRPKGGLYFQSQFECGNLARAVYVGRNEFDLMVCDDRNTRGHTQWYFFGVYNAKPNLEYTFNIINFEKSDSLYNQGMLPVLLSQHGVESNSNTSGWYRTGSNVCYYQNPWRKSNGRSTFSLSFSVRFPDSGACYLAYSVPYTHSGDLMSDLKSIMDDSTRAQWVTSESTLCMSLAGERLPLFEITDDSDSTAVEDKKVAVISARVHPGEAVSSWMMRGVLFFLTGPSPEAAELRRVFRFKLVPMINVDGVVLGNYRCSFAGVDLNRQYRDPSRAIVPEVYYLKELLADPQTFLFCDLHGHSNKKDVFMYGCPGIPPNCRDPEAVVGTEKLWPLLVSEINPSFNFSSCTFKISKSKAGTGRQVVYNALGVQHCYTMEASLGGGAPTGGHYSVKEYQSLGIDVLLALLTWNSLCYGEGKLDPEQMLERVQRASLKDAELDDGDGSDADPSVSNLNPQELQSIWHKTLAESRSQGHQPGKQKPQAQGKPGSAQKQKCGPQQASPSHGSSFLTETVTEIREEMVCEHPMSVEERAALLLEEAARTPSRGDGAPASQSLDKPVQRSLESSHAIREFECATRGPRVIGQGPGQKIDGNLSRGHALYDHRVVTPSLWERNRQRELSLRGTGLNPDWTVGNRLPVKLKVNHPGFVPPSESQGLFKPRFSEPGSWRSVKAQPVLSTFLLPSSQTNVGNIYVTSGFVNAKPRAETQAASNTETIARSRQFNQTPALSIAGLLDYEAAAPAPQPCMEPRMLQGAPKLPFYPAPGINRHLPRRVCKPGRFRAANPAPYSLPRPQSTLRSAALNVHVSDKTRDQFRSTWPAGKLRHSALSNMMKPADHKRPMQKFGMQGQDDPPTEPFVGGHDQAPSYLIRMSRILHGDRPELRKYR